MLQLEPKIKYTERTLFSPQFTQSMRLSRHQTDPFLAHLALGYRCSSAFIGGYMISLLALSEPHPTRQGPPISGSPPPKTHPGAIIFAGPEGPVSPWLP
jgi:hypothetical protein